MFLYSTFNIRKIEEEYRHSENKLVITRKYYTFDDITVHEKFVQTFPIYGRLGTWFSLIFTIGGHGYKGRNSWPWPYFPENSQKIVDEENNYFIITFPLGPSEFKIPKDLLKFWPVIQYWGILAAGFVIDPSKVELVRKNGYLDVAGTRIPIGKYKETYYLLSLFAFGYYTVSPYVGKSPKLRVSLKWGDLIKDPWLEYEPKFTVSDEYYSSKVTHIIANVIADHRNGECIAVSPEKVSKLCDQCLLKEEVHDLIYNEKKIETYIIHGLTCIDMFPIVCTFIPSPRLPDGFIPTGPELVKLLVYDSTHGKFIESDDLKFYVIPWMPKIVVTQFDLDKEILRTGDMCTFYYTIWVLPPIGKLRISTSFQLIVKGKAFGLGSKLYVVDQEKYVISDSFTTQIPQEIELHGIEKGKIIMKIEFHCPIEYVYPIHVIRHVYEKEVFLTRY